MGEAKIAAPWISTWFFQRFHRPCVQYGVELEFLDEFLDIQVEQQVTMETAFVGENRQGLAIPVLRPSHYL